MPPDDIVRSVVARLDDLGIIDAPEEYDVEWPGRRADPEVCGACGSPDYEQWGWFEHGQSRTVACADCGTLRKVPWDFNEDE